MADVFLSYARANFSRAQVIAARLKDHGFAVWFDENLPAHRAFADVIEEQLEAARSVLVLWSKDAVASQWVRSEANRGRETGRLVQVRLDETRLPMPFDQIQCADLSKWSGDEDAATWQSVLASICVLAGQEVAGHTTQDPKGASPANAASRRRVILAAAVLLRLAASVSLGGD